MRINAIDARYHDLSRRKFPTNVPIESPPINTHPKDTHMISFKSGNSKHIAHVVAEEPLFGFSGGGVGTVSHDYNFLDKGYEKITKLIPMYNQEMEYKIDIDPKTGEVKGTVGQGVKVRKVPNNLPANHPLKGHEGVAFITPEKIDKTTDIIKLLEEKRDKVFLLDEVGTSTMSWGLEEKVPIKMFKARKDENLIKLMGKKGMSPELQNKLEFVFTFVDSTSSMAKPYGDNSYSFAEGSDLAKRISSGWKGQEYAKYDKAIVELLPELKSKHGIDPAYILCSDGQSMPLMHYAAQKNAAGDKYWLDKFLGGVGHNMNAGYDQPMGARQAIVNLGATKEEIEKLINSKEYLEALKLGEEEKFLRETVLKNFYKEKGGMTAFHIPIHYAQKGYVPMLTTVSEGYHQSIINNDLVSVMYEDLKALDQLGKFKGITNPLMDPGVTAFKDSILQAGYKNDIKIKLKDGKEITYPKFRIFEEAKKYDLKHIREVKQHNKINLIERFDPKFIDAIAYDNSNKKWLDANTGRMELTTGAAGRKAKIYGGIDKKYVDELKKGKDIKLITSWGRGDFQKGMDIVIDSFEKYAKKDKDAILIFGGDMKYAPDIVEKFKKANAKANLKGRMIFMDGWTPGKDFAMAADVALLPSRFAPCELTDLEAKKALCTPIVPNVQGMAQKNFDPSIAKEAALMDGYKGKHEFFITEKTALEAANPKAKKAFNDSVAALEKELKAKFRAEVGSEMPEELLRKTIKGSDKYNKALNALRDSVVADEMAECLERALITDRNGKIPETILKNHVDSNTTWFGNAWLNSSGKSSGDLYREYHFSNRGKNISEADLIKLDFSGLTPANKKWKVGNLGQKIKEFLSGKGGKITAAALGTIAVIGTGYGLYKGYTNKNNKVEKRLSTIG